MAGILAGFTARSAESAVEKQLRVRRVRPAMFE
jgi:hypothetical protein